MEYTIRPATLADTAGIGEVARAAWEATYAHSIAPHNRRQFLERAYAPEVLREAIEPPGNWFYVATLAETIVGYAHYVCRFDTQWELVRLYVHPDHQRRGIGRLFLWIGAAAMLAAGATQCYASVETDNGPALAFYQRFGFQPQRTYTRWLGDQLIQLVEIRASPADLLVEHHVV
jgi:ribosomal protein S18 acetylase RimI-like enzyme